MRSLWSGVSGLQAHQVGMDVQGNNIANVNTVGYKYSRTNFSDMLSQTSKISTAPDDPLGGRNATQVGLGSTVGSITHVFSQGSRQSTDVKTDVSIEGDGFFVVSADSGITKKYTRAGNFDLDANGNFVNTAGLVVQGWNKDDKNVIDTTKPTGNIKIDPGLTVPAKTTENVTLRANLTSGPVAGTYTPIYALDSNQGDTDGDGTVNETGESVADPTKPNMSSSAPSNQKPEDIGALFNDSGKGYNLQNGQGMWASFAPTKILSDEVADSAGATTNLDITVNKIRITATVAAGDKQARASAMASIINAYTPQTGVSADTNGSGKIIFSNTNQVEGDSKKNILVAFNNEADVAAALKSADFDDAAVTNNFATLTAAGADPATVGAITAYKYTYTDAEIASGPAYDAAKGTTANVNKTFHSTEDLRQLLQEQAGYDADKDNYDTDPLLDQIGQKKQPPAALDAGGGALVKVDTNGRFVITNPDVTKGRALYIGITSINGDSNGTGVQTTPPNTLFTTTFDATEGSLNTGTGSSKASTAMNAAIHGASVDTYDSLGAKHTITYTFRKESTNTWSWSVTVPNPGQLAGVDAADTEKNIYKYGKVSFNTDGSLQSVDPVSLSVTWNNGSTANQEIAMDFGKTSTFNGITSTASGSTTSLIAQDGYASGSLVDQSIDQNGVLVGTFSNGQNIGLAQIALAKFANNEGLESDGGNLFNSSANSGDPTIGTAASGGRGALFANSLEMSNVDLSKALTDMIVIQRGYQANSKTITTSDQMLQVLLQIKN